MTGINTEQFQQLYGDTLPIAIIGAGCRFPRADNIFEFWRRLADGEELIDHFDHDELQAAGVSPDALKRKNFVPAAAVLDNTENFEWSFFGYSRQEAESIDPQQRFFLMCAWEALEMAGYQAGKRDARIGVIGASRISSYLLAEPEDAQNITSAEVFQKLMGNDKDYLATRVAYKLGLTGPAFTVQTACSSSLVATHLACEMIASGDADMMLAGGVSISFPQQAGYYYREGMIFSPDGRCRPFDAQANGTLVGNGAGVVLLKRLDRALEDGDAILSVIRGTAINNDGNMKAGYTAPSVEGQRNVITDALAIADVSPTTIDLVEAHGTATPLGDPIEVSALTQAWAPFSPQRQQTALGSLKSNLGHLDTTAGVAGLLKASLAIWQQQIPPSLNFNTPNPAIDFDSSPFYVPQTLLPWPKSDTPKRAGVSSFGIGGTNSHAIIEAAPPRSDIANSNQPLPLLLSSRSLQGLHQLALRHAARLSEREAGFNAHAYAATSFHHRSLFSHRLLLQADDVEGWINRLLDFAEQSGATEFTTVKCAADINAWFFRSHDINDSEFNALIEACGRTDPQWEKYIPAPAVRILMPVSPFDGERCWRNQEHSKQTPSVIVTDSDLLQGWQALCGAGHKSAQDQAITLDLSGLDVEEACIDALHQHYVSQMLLQTGVFADSSTFVSVDQLMALAGIPKRHTDLIQRLLRDLAASGALQVQRSGDTLRYGTLQQSLIDVESWLTRMDDAGYRNLASLISRTGPQLIAMLRGDIDPVSVVFPAAATDDVEHMYQEQPWSVYFNRIAAASVSALAKSLTRPLRILEIGGGTGGTSRDVLHALPAGCCSRYTFTDLGPLFLQRAKEKFTGFEFIEFAQFDMEKPAQQQLPEQEYDLIIAANVLHNAHDLRHMLKNISSLLAPGGSLLMREITAPKKLFDFVFGPLVPPIADTALRHGELFASQQVWQEALQDVGFMQTDAFPAAGLDTAALGEQIIVARWPHQAISTFPLPTKNTLQLEIPADGLTTEGLSSWSAPHMLHTVLDALPDALSNHNLQDLRWIADPRGADDPLPLHILQQGNHLQARVKDQVLFEARMAVTRVPSSLNTALPESLPGPWSRSGVIYHWHWQPVSPLPATASHKPVLAIATAATLAELNKSDDIKTLDIENAIQQPEQFHSRLTGDGTVYLIVDDAPNTQQILFTLLNQLLQSAPSGMSLKLLAKSIFTACPGDTVEHLLNAWLIGYLNVARHEFPRLNIQLIDCGKALPSDLVDSVPQTDGIDSPQLAWRDRGWHTPILRPATLTAPQPLPAGRHILVGGLSPLGLALAASLADEGATHLVFLTRRQPNDDEKRHIGRLQQRGVHIVVDSHADAADEQAFAKALERLAAQPDAIAIIYHLAGTLHDAPIAQLSWQSLEQVMAPKLQAARLLNSWQDRLQPAQTIYFSSAATVLGPAGQAAHAATNTQLEALAQQRCANGHDTLAVAWGYWKITQTKERSGLAQYLQSQGMLALDTADALALLHAARNGSDAVCAIMQLDWARLAEQMSLAADRYLFASLMPSLSAGVTPANTEKSDDQVLTLTEQVRSIIAELLRCPVASITNDANLVSLGLDSLMFLDLSQRLQKTLGIALNAELALKATTLSTFIAALQESIKHSPIQTSGDIANDETNAVPSDIKRYLKDKLSSQLRCSPSEFDDDSNLVQLGLDSLMFLDLNEALNRDLGVKLNAESVFSMGTFSELTEAVAQNITTTTNQPTSQSILRLAMEELEHSQGDWLTANGDICPRNKTVIRLPMTPLQRIRWQAGNETARHLYVEYDKPADFPINRFEQAWNALVARHPMLRSTVSSDGEIHIAEETSWYDITQFDWRKLTPKQQIAEQLKLRERMSHHTLDLQSWPHFSLCVSQVNDKQIRLHLDINTLLVDIESFRVVLRELDTHIQQPTKIFQHHKFTPQDYQLSLLALAQTNTAIRTAVSQPLPPAPAVPFIAATIENKPVRFNIYREALPCEQWLRLKHYAEEFALNGTDVLLAVYGLALRQWTDEQAFTLRLDYTDRQPIHGQAVGIVMDATTVTPIALQLTLYANFMDLARSCKDKRTQHLATHLPANTLEVEWTQTLPVAFTSLLGVRQAYAIPEVSDPLLGMPNYEYASQPMTPLHLQALEEESALLFNIDIHQHRFPQPMGEILLLTIKQLLETLSELPDAWQVPLNELMPSDPQIVALANATREVDS